jgi:hypothetical protein
LTITDLSDRRNLRLTITSLRDGGLRLAIGDGSHSLVDALIVTARLAALVAVSSAATTARQDNKLYRLALGCPVAVIQVIEVA